MLLDIGSGELLALVILAAVLLGPEKVPEMSRKAARILRFLRRVANNATDQIKAELGPEYADLHLDDLKPKNLVERVLPSDMQSEMDALRAEIAGMRAEVGQMQRQTEAEIGDLSKAVELPPVLPDSTAVASDSAGRSEAATTEPDRAGT